MGWDNFKIQILLPLPNYGGVFKFSPEHEQSTMGRREKECGCRPEVCYLCLYPGRTLEGFVRREYESGVGILGILKWLNLIK